MTSSTQPGWYDDPEDANGQRYWDGQAWTPHRQKKPVSQAPAAPSFPPPQPTSAPGFAPAPPPQQAGWQPPGYPPPGPPSQGSKTPIVLISVLAVAIVVVGGVFFAWKKHVFSTPSSNEDQIRWVVQHEEDDINASRFAFDPQVECKAQEAGDKKMEKMGPKILAKTGKWKYSVANIHVTGDSATADVTVKFAKLPEKPKTSSFQFVKEDGKWKECSAPDSSDDGDQGDDDSGN
jgi:hypothetical protein